MKQIKSLYSQGCCCSAKHLKNTHLQHSFISSANSLNPLGAFPVISSGGGETGQKSFEMLNCCSGYKVAKVGDDFVVKFGKAGQVNLLEGVNMLFVQQATKVKVPRVYALYNDPESSMNYIVMEFIKGNTLDTQWACLADYQKDCHNTQTVLQRTIRSSLARVLGSIGKSHLLHGISWTSQPTPSINGPFNSEALLNEALALKYIGASDSHSAYKADFYRRSLSDVFRGHRPKFTHGRTS
ncbi:hypothetical protein AJ79_06336 [Helicocarpus griseus UAMH5409]|uniref:Aminoglycoside phosphotransferase domain-containing protein n=1 Tax=Helicocarpus griseus UAMH5409 TaxID=1447875 RepID=A0A2B7XES1_9EURO|nr:hypothetical protein AJ79_06336 [Helicocarpus griseus UAMH5409]